MYYMPLHADHDANDERIVLCIANTHQSIRYIHIDENKILSGKHILRMYQVYPWHIQGKSITMKKLSGGSRCNAVPKIRKLSCSFQ
jgi:hypothetical protein